MQTQDIQLQRNQCDFGTLSGFNLEKMNSFTFDPTISHSENIWPSHVSFTLTALTSNSRFLIAIVHYFVPARSFTFAIRTLLAP